jgi:hypothetical protein
MAVPCRADSGWDQYGEASSAQRTTIHPCARKRFSSGIDYTTGHEQRLQEQRLIVKPNERSAPS